MRPGYNVDHRTQEAHLLDPNPIAGKACITGTGRCGTTALMRILTAYDPALTGYDHHTSGIMRDAQAGMERIVDGDAPRDSLQRLPRVWKDPRLCYSLDGLLQRGYRPSVVIVPIRRLEEVGKSRLRANRPWFPDCSVDLSRVPRDQWPAWATEEAQARAAGEALGTLMTTLAFYRVPHVVVRWLELQWPEVLWEALCQPPVFGTAAGSPRHVLGLDEHQFHAAHAAVWGHLVGPLT